MTDELKQQLQEEVSKSIARLEDIVQTWAPDLQKVFEGCEKSITDKLEKSALKLINDYHKQQTKKDLPAQAYDSLMRFGYATILSNLVAQSIFLDNKHYNDDETENLERFMAAVKSALEMHKESN